MNRRLRDKPSQNPLSGYLAQAAARSGTSRAAFSCVRVQQHGSVSVTPHVNSLEERVADICFKRKTGV